METIIYTEDLCFRNIIRYPDISITSSGANFITGPSGCGKSTLLRLFNKTASPTSGRIMYQDSNIAQLDAITLRKEILLISQSIYLFEDSIAGNFYKYYEYRKLPPPSEDTMNQYLELCAAPFPVQMNCTNMSGGERQRVYLAIFLSFHPKVLLLDEPTSALDPTASNMVIGNMKDFCAENGISLAVVSHDEALCRQFADYHISL